jgi:hypothetical protein
MNEKPIPKDEAFRLCALIREQNQGRLYTFGGMMCWGCMTFGKNDPARMCVSSRPDYRGCLQVNARFDRSQQPDQVEHL